MEISNAMDMHTTPTKGKGMAFEFDLKEIGLVNPSSPNKSSIKVKERLEERKKKLECSDEKMMNVDNLYEKIDKANEKKKQDMTKKSTKLNQAIELIEQFTANTSNFDDYVHDLKTQSAVERQLGIIGEAVNKFDQLVPKNTLENARKIVGFRNRIIHAYDAVDSSMIWAILKKYLPQLKFEIIQKLDSHT